MFTPTATPISGLCAASGRQGHVPICKLKQGLKMRGIHFWFFHLLILNRTKVYIYS